MVTLQDAVRY